MFTQSVVLQVPPFSLTKAMRRIGPGRGLSPAAPGANRPGAAARADLADLVGLARLGPGQARRQPVEQLLHLGQAPLQLLEVPRRGHLRGVERRARQAVDPLAGLAGRCENGLQHGAGLLGREHAPDLALAGGARLTQERMIEERAEHVDFSPPRR